MSERLGKAEVQYGDFSGTVAIDGPDQPDRLYELAGLSSDEWAIVAYDVFGNYAATWASVWVVPRDGAKYDDWKAAAQAGAETIEARRISFQVDAKDAAVTLLGLNKRWSVHAVHRSIVDLGLDLEDSEEHEDPWEADEA